MEVGVVKREGRRKKMEGGQVTGGKGEDEREGRKKKGKTEGI